MRIFHQNHRPTVGRAGAVLGLLAAAVTGTALLVSPAIGFGAAPKAGGVYKGTVGGATSLQKRVSIAVSKNGKSGRVTWYCGSGRGATSSKSFPIRHGRFKFVKKIGKSFVVWSFRGRFVSNDEGRAQLTLSATCDGKGGTVILNRIMTVSDQLAQARNATAKFRSVATAEAAGYVATSACASSADGATGIQYENQALMQDPKLDIRTPEMLLYEPNADGTRTLVAAEYFKVDADQNVVTVGDRPTLFSHPFDGPMQGHNPGMAVHYDLHVWLWKANPSGTFFLWNPTVHC